MEKAHIELPDPDRATRRYNCLRVYEAEEFDGMTDVTIAVLGWLDLAKPKAEQKITA